MFAVRRAVRGRKRDFVAMLRHLDAPHRGGAFIQVAIELRSCSFLFIIRRILWMQRPE